MRFLKTALVVATLCGSAALLPAMAQDTIDPNGSFVDQWGTIFQFSTCGDGDLCGTLVDLKGDSATEENLAFVGTQVMQAAPSGPNAWKGTMSAGGLSGEATVTFTSANTVDIQGCRAAILCQTITYTRQ